MKSVLNLTLAVVVGLLGYYYFAFNFFYQTAESDAFPYLRSRFGTILSHSSDSNPKTNLTDLQYHPYCYYPKAEESYNNKAGEYIIKRVDSYKDCQNWYGVVVFREGNWVSEREKIWWNEENKKEANLAKEENLEYLD